MLKNIITYKKSIECISFFLLLLNPMKMIIFAYKNKTDKSNGQDCSQGYHNKDNV